MSAFQTAYQLTMGHEGSYNNDPRDNGGETCCGIARNIWPAWEGWQLVDKLKGNRKQLASIAKALRENEDLSRLVEGFYKANYWDVLSLDDIPDEAVTSELFEQSVNLGTPITGRHFQFALNLLNENSKAYKDLKLDSWIGPKTLTAYRAFMATESRPSRSHERNVRTIVKVLNALQFDRYRDFCEAHPDQKIFLYGWLNRV